MVDKARNISHLLTQVSKESFSASRSNGGGLPYGLNALGWAGAAITFAAPTAAFAAAAAAAARPVIVWLVAVGPAKMTHSVWGKAKM